MLIHEILTEAATSVLFHYAGAATAAGILEQGYFDLEQALGNSAEEDYMPPGKPYFLATTRSRTGDYHRTPTKNSVLFTLDGDYLNSRYTVKPIDYYSGLWRVSPFERGRESEDRVFSKSSKISVLPMVKHIDIYLARDREPESDRDPFRDQELRRIMTAAYNLRIPMTFYKTRKGWMTRAPGDRVDLETVVKMLTPEPEPREPRIPHSYARHIKAYLELLEKNRSEDLSKDADKILYDYILYAWERDNSQLRNDLHNARPGETDYPIAVKLVDAMLNLRLKTTAQLTAYLKEKWQKIRNREQELEKQNEVK